MMAMVDPRHTALFMGIWTIGRSIADASAVLGGGLIFEVARRVVGSVAGGYASVFAVEAIGLAVILPILFLGLIAGGFLGSDDTMWMCPLLSGRIGCA